MGLARFEEKQLRVYDALAGETVIARYLFGRSQRGKAATLEVLQRSADRVAPRCPHFGSCGACSLQHMSMDAQLARKKVALMESLREIGSVKPRGNLRTFNRPAMELPAQSTAFCPGCCCQRAGTCWFS